MDLIITIFKVVGLGFLGLIGLLFLLAVLFGKRIIKQWEYEAEFRDEKGREFGEFEVELSRIAKEEAVDSYKAKFRMRHESLQTGQRVQVFLEQQPILEGSVTTAGRIYLTAEHMVSEPADAAVGQICRVVYGGQERFQAELQPD